MNIMKNSELSLMGVQEMNPLEMQETDGGVVLIILGVCAAVLALSSCVNGPLNIQIGGSHNSITPTGGGTIRADSSKLEIPIDVPIGY
jgi:hypothetical protein